MIERHGMSERCPLVAELEIAPHASKDAHVRQEEADAHGRGTLADSVGACRRRVSMCDAAASAVETIAGAVWNGDATRLRTRPNFADFQRFRHGAACGTSAAMTQVKNVLRRRSGAVDWTAERLRRQTCPSSVGPHAAMAVI